MFNKRYAILGWLTWQVGKRKAAQKAKAGVPSADKGRRSKQALMVSALAAAGAAVFFWRRRGDSGEAADADEPASADQ